MIGDVYRVRTKPGNMGDWNHHACQHGSLFVVQRRTLDGNLLGQGIGYATGLPKTMILRPCDLKRLPDDVNQ